MDDDSWSSTSLVNIILKAKQTATFINGSPELIPVKLEKSATIDKKFDFRDNYVITFNRKVNILRIEADIKQCQSILPVVKSYGILLLRFPVQQKGSMETHFSKIHQKLVTQEAQEKRKTAQQQPGFSNHLSLVGKKNGGDRYLINLQDLRNFISCNKFKIIGLYNLTIIPLQDGDFLPKKNLDDAYFSISVHESPKKFGRFI